MRPEPDPAARRSRNDVLSDVFGIELEPVELIPPGAKSPKPPKRSTSSKRPKRRR
jgi:hypothetical protein